jgi:hypothetical protein
VGGNGGDGQGGGAFNGGPSATGAPSLTLERSRIVRNDATGGLAGLGGSDGQGVGGGAYLVPGGTASAWHARIHGNHASTSDEDVFGDLS